MTTPRDYAQPMQIRFSDLDPYGHLATHQYINLVIASRWTYAETKLEVSASDLVKRGVGFYVAEQQGRFVRPIQGQTDVLVRSRVVDLVGTKLHISFEITSMDETKVFFCGQMLCLVVDPKTGKPIALPEWAMVLFFLPETEPSSRTHAHYRTTEAVYRNLSKPASDFMNFGLWPAASLPEAQRKLVERLLTKLNPTGQVVELGSGWGGGRVVLHELYPDCTYHGLNLSTEQIDHARSLTSAMNGTVFSALDIAHEPQAIPTADCAFAVEAFHHFSSKREVLTQLKQRAQKLALAEICVKRRGQYLGHPTLDAPLAEAWTIEDYAAAFQELDAKEVHIERVTDKVIPGMADYVLSLDEDFLGQQPELKAALQRMRSSFSHLQEHAEEGLVGYYILNVTC